MISKEQLEVRLRELTAQKQQLLDSANAVSGAIQLCNMLMIEAAVPESVSTQPNNDATVESK